MLPSAGIRLYNLFNRLDDVYVCLHFYSAYPAFFLSGCFFFFIVMQMKVIFKFGKYLVKLKSGFTGMSVKCFNITKRKKFQSVPKQDSLSITSKTSLTPYVPVAYVILCEVKRAALCWTMTCLAYEEGMRFPQCN